MWCVQEGGRGFPRMAEGSNKSLVKASVAADESSGDKKASGMTLVRALAISRRRPVGM